MANEFVVFHDEERSATTWIQIVFVARTGLCDWSCIWYEGVVLCCETDTFELHTVSDIVVQRRTIHLH